MIKDIFDKKSILKLALDVYPDKHLFDEEEFKKNFNRFFIVRKMARRFVNKEQTNEMLLLNNIIITLNIFGIESSNLIWRTICSDDEFSVVKSCLVFLKSLNPKIESITPNKKILKILNNLKHQYTINFNN